VKYNWPITASAPNIRKDILDELGLDFPTNFDELYEVLKAFKAAYPNSAIWTNRNGTARLLSINAYPMGSGWRMYFDKDVDGGKWLFGPTHPEFKDVLDYFARCYAEGLLDPDFAVTKSDKWHEKNSSGQGLYCWENLTFCVRWNMGLREVNPEATWTPFPVMEGKRGARMSHYPLMVQGWAMGANTENPDRIIKMLDWCWTPEGLDTTNWGVEGTHYRYINGTRPETIEDYSIAGLNKAMAPQKKEILPEVFEKYAEKTDPMRSFKSDAGVGLLGFTTLVDYAVTRLWDPPGESDTWYEMTGRDPGYHAPFDAPPFNAEERERIKEITTNVNAILDPAYDKVIIGQMSLDDYDKVVEQAIGAGTEDLEKIYNEAEAGLT